MPAVALEDTHYNQRVQLLGTWSESHSIARLVIVTGCSKVLWYASTM